MSSAHQVVIAELDVYSVGVCRPSLTFTLDNGCVMHPVRYCSGDSPGEDDTRQRPDGDSNNAGSAIHCLNTKNTLSETRQLAGHNLKRVAGDQPCLLALRTCGVGLLLQRQACFVANPSVPYQGSK